MEKFIHLLYRSVLFREVELGSQSQKKFIIHVSLLNWNKLILTKKIKYNFKQHAIIKDAPWFCRFICDVEDTFKGIRQQVFTAALAQSSVLCNAHDSYYNEVRE